MESSVLMTDWPNEMRGSILLEDLDGPNQAEIADERSQISSNGKHASEVILDYYQLQIQKVCMDEFLKSEPIATPVSNYPGASLLPIIKERTFLRNAQNRDDKRVESSLGQMRHQSIRPAESSIKPEPIHERGVSYEKERLNSSKPNQEHGIGDCGITKHHINSDYFNSSAQFCCLCPDTLDWTMDCRCPRLISPPSFLKMSEMVQAFQVYVRRGFQQLQSPKTMEPLHKSLNLAGSPGLPHPEALNTLVGGIRDAFEGDNKPWIERTRSFDKAFSSIEAIVRSTHFVTIYVVAEITGLMVLRGVPEIAQIFLKQVYQMALVLFNDPRHPIAIFTSNILSLLEIDVSEILREVLHDMVLEILGAQDESGIFILQMMKHSIMNRRNFDAMDLYKHSTDMLQDCKSIVQAKDWVYLEGVLWRFPDYVARCSVGRLDTKEMWATNLKPLALLGLALANQRKFDNAQTVLKQAVRIMSERLGPYHATTLETNGYWHQCKVEMMESKVTIEV